MQANIFSLNLEQTFNRRTYSPTPLYLKAVRALRGHFGPIWGQKIKVDLHKLLLISLLEKQPKCKGLVLFGLLRLLW